MTSINSVTSTTPSIFLLRFRQDGVFRFRMPACRLAERRHRRSPHRSQLPCPDLRLRPHCRTNRRDPNRHEEFSSCTTCHRYRDAGSKCICTSVMVAYDLSKHESKPLTEEWIEAICKYEGRDLRKNKDWQNNFIENKTNTFFSTFA